MSWDALLFESLILLAPGGHFGIRLVEAEADRYSHCVCNQNQKYQFLAVVVSPRRFVLDLVSTRYSCCFFSSLLTGVINDKCSEGDSICCQDVLDAGL